MATGVAEAKARVGVDWEVVESNQRLGPVARAVEAREVAVVVAVEEREEGMAAVRSAALAGAAVGGASQVAGERSLLEAREQGAAARSGVAAMARADLAKEEAVGSAPGWAVAAGVAKVAG